MRLGTKSLVPNLLSQISSTGCKSYICAPQESIRRMHCKFGTIRVQIPKVEVDKRLKESLSSTTQANNQQSVHVNTEHKFRDHRVSELDELIAESIVRLVFDVVVSGPFVNSGTRGVLSNKLLLCRNYIYFFQIVKPVQFFHSTIYEWTSLVPCRMAQPWQNDENEN